MYTLQAADDGYEALASGTAAVAGEGYWLYFPVAREVDLTAGDAGISLPLPASRWILVGNPNGLHTLNAQGADVLFTYDPERGYRVSTALAPGQGAWAYSAAGGTLTIGSADPGGGIGAAAPRLPGIRRSTAWTFVSLPLRTRSARKCASSLPESGSPMPMLPRPNVRD